MRLTRHHSPLQLPQTADDLLRPELESYSTTLLIAELARRGVFRSVPELPIADEPGRSLNGDDTGGEGPRRSRPCATAGASTTSRGQPSVRVRPILRLTD